MRTSWEKVKLVLALSHKIAFQRSFLLTCLRDGPLEKLWWRWGIFEPQEFFFVIKFLVWIFFRPWHEYFLGLIGTHDFFSFNFPLPEYFFLYFIRKKIDLSTALFSGLKKLTNIFLWIIFRTFSSIELARTTHPVLLAGEEIKVGFLPRADLNHKFRSRWFLLINVSFN